MSEYPVYLDNAATTLPCAEAVGAINNALINNYGNPSSLHRAGLDAQLEVDRARKTIADSLGCDSKSIFFTSGATESNNLAIRGAAMAYGRRRRKIVTSSVEHPSVSETVKDLGEKGFDTVRVSPREDGRFYPEDFINACDDDTCLVSMMLVNNETGYYLPVKETFGKIKRKFPEIVTHCDCVQGYMKHNFGADMLSADLLSLSGHKVHAGKGIGALCIRKGIRIVPVMTGGHQERGIRSGTESVPLIAGFGAAVAKIAPDVSKNFEKVSGLRSYLEDKLSGTDGVRINSPADGSPYIINFSLTGYRSEIILHFLEQKGIYVSSGSACSKGVPSGVLEEFGVSRENADSAVRVSMSAETTREDLDLLYEAVREAMKKIRK